jgi:hypothetical protein
MFQYPHLFMLKKETNDVTPLCKRFFAYWILTYGIVRLLQPQNSFLSYAIEAACIANETFLNNTIDLKKGSFVITTCIFLPLFL